MFQLQWEYYKSIMIASARYIPLHSLESLVFISFPPHTLRQSELDWFFFQGSVVAWQVSLGAKRLLPTCERLAVQFRSERNTISSPFGMYPAASAQLFTATKIPSKYNSYHIHCLPRYQWYSCNSYLISATITWEYFHLLRVWYFMNCCCIDLMYTSCMST